jgi:hypothetical protein
MAKDTLSSTPHPTSKPPVSISAPATAGAGAGTSAVAPAEKEIVTPGSADYEAGMRAHKACMDTLATARTLKSTPLEYKKKIAEMVEHFKSARTSFTKAAESLNFSALSMLYCYSKYGFPFDAKENKERQLLEGDPAKANHLAAMLHLLPVAKDSDRTSIELSAEITECCEMLQPIISLSFTGFSAYKDLSAFAMELANPSFRTTLKKTLQHLHEIYNYFKSKQKEVKTGDQKARRQAFMELVTYVAKDPEADTTIESTKESIASLKTRGDKAFAKRFFTSSAKFLVLFQPLCNIIMAEGSNHLAIHCAVKLFLETLRLDEKREDATAKTLLNDTSTYVGDHMTAGTCGTHKTTLTTVTCITSRGVSTLLNPPSVVCGEKKAC